MWVWAYSEIPWSLNPNALKEESEKTVLSIRNELDEQNWVEIKNTDQCENKADYFSSAIEEVLFIDLRSNLKCSLTVQVKVTWCGLCNVCEEVTINWHITTLECKVTISKWSFLLYRMHFIMPL